MALKEIMDRLFDFEFDVITARLDRHMSKEDRIGNINVYRVGFGSVLDKFLLPVLGFLKSMELMNKNSYLASHSYQVSYGAGAAYLSKLFFKNIPLIITVQEGKNLEKQGFFINFFRRWIIRKADFATAISEYLKDYILTVKKDLKTDVIPNGVDLENFSKNFSYGETAALEDKLGIKPDDKVIISVSRLVYKNGLDLVIKSLAVLNNNSRSKYKLILAGSGPLKESLRFQVKNLKLDDYVIFAGTVSHRDLPLYFKISDVFARLSRSEGLGSAFLEAMAAGIPIIGPKIGGIPDFLEDRKTGLFCSHEPEDIAFKVNVIFENEKLKQEIIKNARKLIEEKYDWNIIAGKFKKLYSAL